MTRDKLIQWLRETDPQQLELLWHQADALRRDCVGYAVHLRGLVEVSNHCTRQCAYCGVRSGNDQVQRYRLSADDVVACAHRAAKLGFGTVVLQSGEDPALTCDWVTGVLKRIKQETSLAVTLSLGEREPHELELWREAGADRYLLRFETSDAALFQRIHPPRPGRRYDRLDLLGIMRNLGYEVGSGVMIGLPGQTYDSLARDIELFGTLDLDMIGVGPYLPHPQTPLGALKSKTQEVVDQVPNDLTIVCVVVALARLVRPQANIPSTTAIATQYGPEAQVLALQRGANVIMPNLTPAVFRKRYQIYPDKACYYDDSTEAMYALYKRIRDLGRTVGTGRGDAPSFTRRDHAYLLRQTRRWA